MARWPVHHSHGHRQHFLPDEHPDRVRRWLEAHADLTLWIQENPDERKDAV
jgi:ABC-type nitrate/sulfonate/bicarbonate transport system substrate-binding protein